MDISSQVQHIKVSEGVELYALKTGHEGMVQLKLIRPGGELYCQENRELSRAYASMLDQGSKQRSRDEWAQYSDVLGANIGFDYDEFRQVGLARCLSEDAPKMVQALLEQSLNPLFPKDHWTMVRSRLLGSLDQLKDDTKTQAMIKLLQSFYPEQHPHYSLSIEKSMEMIQSISQQDLMSYHQKIGACLPWVIFAVGDVNVNQLKEVLTREIKKVDMRSVGKLKVKSHVNSDVKGQYHVELKEKSSTDVYLAQPVGIGRDHPDYLSLMLGIYCLGGNFSARLMRTVRDVEGLTYGVYSGLTGVNDNLEGYWYVHGTFAPNLLDKGCSSVMKQVMKWYQEGVSEEECHHRKEGLIGRYWVGMSSIRGLLNALSRNVVQGLGVEYMDQYPQLIQGIRQEDVNRCIRQYISPDQLVKFSSGSMH